MDERVARLETPEECEQLALNVQARLPDLARDALRRAVELRAAAHSAVSEVEREALEAVYAYETAQSKIRRRRFRAIRTWRMIDKHGIIAAVERAVNRAAETTGFTTLAQMGMLDKAFESVVLRHPQVFSPEVVRRSEERLRKWKGESAGTHQDGEHA